MGNTLTGELIGPGIRDVLRDGLMILALSIRILKVHGVFIDRLLHPE